MRAADPSFRTRLKSGLRAGNKKGWASFAWICKILIPTSFLVTLLQWSGLLDQAAPYLNPLMGAINLPGEAALPIISGMLINLYATIAIITVIPFTMGQKTLIAIFNMICHNLIIEGIIQHKSGINVAKINLIRFASAILTVLIVSQVFSETAKTVVMPDTMMTHPSFLVLLETWAIDTGWLLLKILIIIMPIMLGLESAKSLDWISYLIRFFQPIMRALGLSSRTAMLWVVGVIFGLMYGGAVIIEETKGKTLTKDELERLHISIGINHSMVEDPVLFIALGLNGFWMWVPRFITAIAAVQAYRGIVILRQKP